MPAITWKDLYGDVHFEWTGSSCQVRHPNTFLPGDRVYDVQEPLIAHQMARDEIRPSHFVKAHKLATTLTPGQEVQIPELRLDVGRTATGYVVAHEGVVSGPIAFLQNPSDVATLVGMLTARSDEMRLLFAGRCTLDAYLVRFLNADPENLNIDWTSFLDDGETYRTFVREHHVGVGLKSRRKGFEVAVAAMTASVRSWLVGRPIVLPEPTVTIERPTLN